MSRAGASPRRMIVRGLRARARPPGVIGCTAGLRMAGYPSDSEDRGPSSPLETESSSGCCLRRTCASRELVALCAELERGYAGGLGRRGRCATAAGAWSMVEVGMLLLLEVVEVGMLL